MNAHDLRVEEAAATYLVAPPLTDHLATFASAPEGFKRLRELVLNLAVRGRLLPQTNTEKPLSIGSQTLPLSDTPFSIPQSWRWARIGEVLSLINGRAFKPAEWLPSGLPIVRIQNLNNAAAAFNYCDATSVDARHLIDDGEFLISWSGTPGTSFGAFIWTRGRAALNQHIFKCELLTQEIDQVYLRLAINGRLDEMIAKAHGGVGLQHITKGKLEQLALPLPPLAEQSRIIAKVEELMALIDRLEARVSHGETARGKLLDALLTALAASPDAAATADAWAQLAPHFDLLLQTPADVDRLQQTLLTLAVKGRLVPQDPNDEPAAELLKRIRVEKERLVAEGKIRREKPLPAKDEYELPLVAPHGWQWASLGDVVLSSEAGWSPSCENMPRESSKWGVLKVSAVSWGEFLDDENKALPSHLEARPEYEVLPGDFLLSRANTVELVARSVVAWSPKSRLMLSDKIIRLHISKGADKAYFNLFNNSLLARAHYVANASGTSASMKNVSREVVLSLPVPVPPAAEQRRIVAAVASLTALCDRLRDRLAARRDLSAKLAAALTEGALS